MAAEQLSLFPEIDEKQVQTLVVKELKNYKALKVKMENKNEQERLGVNLFPSLRKSEQITKTEELKVKQIDRALQNSLDMIERKIIEKKYLSQQEKKDVEIYIDLGLKKDKFYNKKREAIFNIATSLGII